MKYLYKWKYLQDTGKCISRGLDLFKPYMKLNQYKQWNTCKSLYFKKYLHISFV